MVKSRIRFIGLVFTAFLCNAWADSVNVAPAALTDSLIASMPIVPADPYEELEKIPAGHFQNLVVRAERSRKAAADTTLPKNVRDFAMAASYFYSESWDSAYAAYDSLRSRDSLLEKSVVLRMAKARFMQGDYKQMRNETRWLSARSSLPMLNSTSPRPACASRPPWPIPR